MRSKSLAIALVLIANLLGATQIAKALSGGYASAPLSVTQTAVSGGVTLSWSTPTDATGITSYVIEKSSNGTSWTSAASASSSPYTVLGLAATEVYLRVAAVTSAGTGAYGYPWTKIYSTSSTIRDTSNNVIYDIGYGLSSTTTNASYINRNANFSRVRYRMETTISSVAKYVDVDFYEWPYSGSNYSASWSMSPTINGLAFPSVNSGQQWMVKANVDDLNVYSDNTNVSNVKGGTGRVEIWPWNYDTLVTSTSWPYYGNTNNYDSDDTPVKDVYNNWAGTYGTFQVHDLINTKPVFVWNRFNYQGAPEIGYGAYGGTNPDWTFCRDTANACPEPTAFKLMLYVNIPITPLADTTAPTVTRVDTRYDVRNGWNITVKSTELGTVYLVSDSVTVTNVSSITSATSSLWNSVSISTINTNTTLTPTGLSDGVYKLYAADLLGNLSTPISNTLKMDTTLPVLQSVKVSSSGDSILLTYSETMTNVGLVNGMYTISDGGSVITITGYSVATRVITLNLSRNIIAGASVTYSYTPTNGSAMYRWTDAATNEAGAISSQSVTNESTYGVSATLSTPAGVTKGTRINLSVSVTVVGKVTFTYAGKRISGCINLVASGSSPITVTCSWKPAVTGTAKIAVILYPTSGLLSTTYSNIVYPQVTRRTSNR